MREGGLFIALTLSLEYADRGLHQVIYMLHYHGWRLRHLAVQRKCLTERTFKKYRCFPAQKCTVNREVTENVIPSVGYRLDKNLKH